MPEVNPVFIVGAGRSGTTPLQLALNMHPQLGVYGETQAFFVRRKFDAKAGGIRLRRLLQYWRTMVASCSPFADLLESEEIQRKLAESPDYAQILNLIMGGIAAREGKSRWGEKTPAHLFRLSEIRSCFPNARIIHIVRDPRAVVCSNIKAFGDGRFTDSNVYFVAKYWLRCMRIHQRQQGEQVRGRYIHVRYEDFVNSPEGTLQDISSFLGIDFVREMCSFHRTASNYVQKDQSGGIPVFHSLTQKPLDPSRTEAWKTILSPEQTKLIEQVAGAQMAGFGYQVQKRRAYQPPRMRVTYFLGRWMATEGRRIAYRQGQTMYWAIQRTFGSRDVTQSTSGTLSAQRTSNVSPKRTSVGLPGAGGAPDQVSGTGT